MALAARWPLIVGQGRAGHTTSKYSGVICTYKVLPRCRSCGQCGGLPIYLYPGWSVDSRPGVDNGDQPRWLGSSRKLQQALESGEVEVGDTKVKRVVVDLVGWRL